LLVGNDVAKLYIRIAHQTSWQSTLRFGTATPVSAAEPTAHGEIATSWLRWHFSVSSQFVVDQIDAILVQQLSNDATHNVLLHVKVDYVHVDLSEMMQIGKQLCGENI